MKSAGLATRLLNVAPPGGGTTFQSVCSGMGKTYLVKGSNPATGLFIEKLNLFFIDACGRERHKDSTCRQWGEFDADELDRRQA